MEIKIRKDYQNPEKRKIEIVERKGLGHPDTIADKLAGELSRVYSKYCMDNYGVILHHNIDKLYVGAGLFLLEDGKIKRHHKIRVDLNGRVSNSMNGKMIDLERIFVPVIQDYMGSILPRLNPKEDLEININCTQRSKREYWYQPRDKNDVPDSSKLFAADTALCVSYGKRTYCEELAYKLEQFFWKTNKDGYPTPKYDDIGQDIKVMVSRIGKDVVASISLPVFKDKYNSKDEYDKIVIKYENKLNEYLTTIDNPLKYNVKVEVDRMPDDTYQEYVLVLGSCIECGEEGLVGRGNDSQGLISSVREHTMEAPSGKNLRYHTGRVVSYMANNATKRIAEELGVACTLYALTRNRGSILRPYLFYLSVDDVTKRNECKRIINEEFTEEKLLKILDVRNF